MKFLSAGSVEDALTYLDTYASNSSILAGGTDLMIQLQRAEMSPEVLIHIEGIPGLAFVRKNGGVTIGALTTHLQLVQAQELVIYPAKGQSAEQMDKDKYECYTWAKQQSGFDPMAPPTATEAPPAQEAQKGGLVKGGLRGAAVGGAVGKIANDDASKGAKSGAAAGAIVGGIRKQDQKKQQQKSEEQWAQDQTANYAKNRDSYNRAHTACLEGKGYTVK